MDILDIPTIEDEHIENLQNYKYTSGEYTFLDNQMNHFWYFCARFVPSVICGNFFNNDLPKLVCLTKYAHNCIRNMYDDSCIFLCFAYSFSCSSWQQWVRYSWMISIWYLLELIQLISFWLHLFVFSCTKLWMLLMENMQEPWNLVLQ